MSDELELNNTPSDEKEAAAKNEAGVVSESGCSTDEGDEAGVGAGKASEADLSESIASARRAMRASERFFTGLGNYELNRLDYKLSIDKYRFSIDPNAVQKHEKLMNRRIFGARVRILRARLFERSDNRRYLAALRMDVNKLAMRGVGNPETINKKKQELLSLVEERRLINEQLAALYAELHSDYANVASSKRMLKTKLRAAKRAHRKLREAEQGAIKYVFSTDDKAKLYDYMNHSVDLASEYAVLRHRSKGQISESERARLRAEMATNRQERARIERTVYSVVAKARRKAYLFGDGGLWRWVIGIAVLVAIIIAVFFIFHEPLTDFFVG